MAGADQAAAQPLLVQTLTSLTACFKGLSPSDDMFDLTDEGDEGTDKEDAIRLAREDARMISLRRGIESCIYGVVSVWNGDGEIADVSRIQRATADLVQAISSVVKHSTSGADTLISLSPLPLLSLVCAAAERSPSGLWMALSATLILRINSPPSPLTKKRDLTTEETLQLEEENNERWNVVGDAALKLVVIANNMLSGTTGLRDVSTLVHRSWI
jgi:hypothetical protein